MNLHPIDIKELSFNPFEKIDKGWFLITSGDLTDYNTMTASWGTMGIFWGKPVVNAFVRPQRYTYEYVEKNELFTISFYDEEYRSALQYCGTHSGRDVDKAKECNLTPIELDGSVAFDEASLVFVCKKLYYYDLTPEQMIDMSIDKWYAAKDYHRCYFGEILKVFGK